MGELERELLGFTNAEQDDRADELSRKIRAVRGIVLSTPSPTANDLMILMV